MKRLPKGTWHDTQFNRDCRVVYYDSKSKCYRVEIRLRDLGGPRRGGWFRMWVGVETFKPPRYQPPTAWSAVSDGVDVGP